MIHFIYVVVISFMFFYFFKPLCFLQKYFNYINVLNFDAITVKLYLTVKNKKTCQTHMLLFMSTITVLIAPAFGRHHEFAH